MRGRRSQAQRAWLAALALGLALAAAGPGAAEEAAPSVRDVLRDTGFSNEEIARVEAGELVKGELQSTSERELAVAMAFLVKLPTEELIERLRAYPEYRYDPAVIAFAELRGEASPADLREVSLGPDAAGLLDAYLNAAPGSELNLSRQEIASFRALQGQGDARERVEGQLRLLLLDRYRAYRQKGLAGVAPYAREDGDYAPGERLRRKLAQDEGLRRDAPALYRAMLEYPNAPAEGAVEQFYWVGFRIDDLPTFALVHRMEAEIGDVYAFAERHFYVSRSHNSVQVFGGAFPVEGGTIIAYVNRTSTDRINGFGRAARRSLGQRVMAGQLAQYFERARAGEERRKPPARPRGATGAPESASR